jgi:copper(I)-binding protein
MHIHKWLGALLLSLIIATAGRPAIADDMAGSVTKLGSLEISGAFARATLPGAKTGGGYFTVANTGNTDDKLIAISSPAAAISELHAMSMEGSVMEMRPAGSGIDIPAGKTVTLSPSGLHVMFMNITEPFKKGSTIPVTLTFAKAGKVDLTLDVLGIAAKAPMAGMAM